MKEIKKSLLIGLFILLAFSATAQSGALTLIDDVKLIGPVSETIYEDAEDGSNHRWNITATSIPGAEIKNIYNNAKNSNVIQLVDNNTNAYFELTNGSGSPSFSGRAFNNTTEFTIQWSLNFNVDFQVIILVSTPSGYKTLYYTPIDYDRGYLAWGNGWIHHGIGSYLIGNGWQTVTRDLQADLAEYIPDLPITSVMFFTVKEIGDYLPPEPPSAKAHTIGFWKNNIKKAIQNKNKGYQIDKTTLLSYLDQVNMFYESPFSSLTLESAYDILSAKGSDAVKLLKKQLLASQLSYFNGAFLLGDPALTVTFLQEGEDILLNPDATREELLALKDQYDAFNNNEITQ